MCSSDLGNPVLQEAITYAIQHKKPVHLIGLVSDGGVHAHINHIKAMCDIISHGGVSDLFIHAFTDGRDTDPKSGVNYLTDLQNHLKHSSGKIASVVGRYYAMDRDNRWERVKLAYDLLVRGVGKKSKDPVQALKDSYQEGITDEFVHPVAITGDDGEPLAKIHSGDVVI